MTADRLDKKDGSFRSHVVKQFRKNRLAVFSLRFVYLLIFIALSADFIANEKPLAAVYKSKLYFPVLRSYAVDAGLAQWQREFLNVEWSKLNYDFVLFPPVPYLPKNIDSDNNQSTSPVETQHVKSRQWRHWLGTDELGHDVLSGMVHGTRIALTVGLISMSIAAFIGVLLGSLAGYFGDNRLKVSRGRVILNLLFLYFAFFYSVSCRSYLLSDALGSSFGMFIVESFISLLLFTGIMAIANILARPLKSIGWFKKRISIPVDIIISRLIEIMLSVPTLFLILAIVAIAKPSLYLVMAVIGFTSWTGIARFIRAELLKVRSLEYIESARALGFPELRILLRHAIPNALSPVLISIAFGIASAILTESILSFLGVGVPPEMLTWGSLLSAARSTPSAWWLAVFPGFAIFITVTVYNLIGEGLTDALDPRMRK